MGRQSIRRSMFRWFGTRTHTRRRPLEPHLGLLLSGTKFRESHKEQRRKRNQGKMSVEKEKTNARKRTMVEMNQCVSDFQLKNTPRHHPGKGEGKPPRSTLFVLRSFLLKGSLIATRSEARGSGPWNVREWWLNVPRLTLAWWTRFKIDLASFSNRDRCRVSTRNKGLIIDKNILFNGSRL
jgi:hypothetical protein